MPTTSFNKKPKTKEKITYILFWVNWLADHAPKYARDHLTNPPGPTETSIKSKNYFHITRSKSKATFKKKSKRIIKQGKTPKMC